MLKDLRWAWPGVSHALEKHHARVFDSEGRINDGGWILLSAATIKARFFGWNILGSVTGAYESRSGEGEDGRVLHWTYRLRNSLADQTPDSIRQMLTTKMIWGTKAPHAAILHGGGQSNVGPLPPRPIIDPKGSQSVVVDKMQSQVDWLFSRGGRGARF